MRQTIADNSPQPEKHGQPGIVQIAFQLLRQVEESVLEHVGGVDSTVEPGVHAQLDDPSQPVAVPLEQLGERTAIPGFKPLQQTDRFTGRVAHVLAPYFLTGATPRVRDKKIGFSGSIAVPTGQHRMFPPGWTASQSSSAGRSRGVIERFPKALLVRRKINFGDLTLDLVQSDALLAQRGSARYPWCK